MKRVLDKDRKYTPTCQIGYTHYDMSLIECCFFAALIDGLRLIDEKAMMRGVNVDKLDSHALVDYVQRKGVVIYYLQQKEQS